MARFTESVVEEAVLERAEGLGYVVLPDDWAKRQTPNAKPANKQDFKLR